MIQKACFGISINTKTSLEDLMNMTIDELNDYAQYLIEYSEEIKKAVNKK